MFKHLKNAVSKTKSVGIVGLATMAFANPSFGAGVERVNKTMEMIKTVLTSIAVVVVTIAILVAGYKIIFGGQTFREVAPILVGGVIIGAAAEIASLLVG
jgi:trbC/VIRB2 family